MYNTYLSNRNEDLLNRVVETPLKKEKKAAPRILFNHVSSSAFLS